MENNPTIVDKVLSKIIFENLIKNGKVTLEEAQIINEAIIEIVDRYNHTIIEETAKINTLMNVQNSQPQQPQQPQINEAEMNRILQSIEEAAIEATQNNQKIIEESEEMSIAEKLASKVLK